MRPENCLYCDGLGNSSAGGACGFCDNGKPVDTEDDWKASWGTLFERLREFEAKKKRKKKQGT